jgi:RimJ/RimL family protein N-acetyltransferase
MRCLFLLWLLVPLGNGAAVVKPKTCVLAMDEESQAGYSVWQKISTAMTALKTKSFQTERLTLKALDPADKAKLGQIVREGADGLFPKPPTAADIDNVVWAAGPIDNMLIDSTGPNIAIYETKSQRCVGYISFYYGAKQGHYSTTYAIAKDVQGQGYATEALKALLNVYRKHSDKSIPFTVFVKTGNTSSMKVLTNSGLESSDEKNLAGDGTALDLKTFKLPE